MTIDGIINKLSEFSSWLYHRRWERWELLAIAIVVLAIIILKVRAYLKLSVDKNKGLRG